MADKSGLSEVHVGNNSVTAEGAKALVEASVLQVLALSLLALLVQEYKY